MGRRGRTTELLATAIMGTVRVRERTLGQAEKAELRRRQRSCSRSSLLRRLIKLLQLRTLFASSIVALAAFSACLISRASRNSSRLERRRVARIWSIAGFSSKAARFDALGTASPSHFGTEACRLRRAPGERKRRRLLAAPKTAVALARETFGCSRSAATILSESTQFPHHDAPLEGTVKNLIAGRRQAPHTSKQRPVSCSVSACMLLCSLSSSSMLRSTVSVQKLVREPTEALHTGHRGERSASM